MALEKADLVLTEESRAVYWMGTEVDLDWQRNGAMWDYSVTLCELAKQGRPVDGANLGDDRKADNHSKRKSRRTTSSNHV